MKHWPWQHNWKLKTLRKIRYSRGDLATELFYMCTCKKVKKREIKGHWDPEDLT